MIPTKPDIKIWIHRPDWVSFDVHDDYEIFLEWFEENFSVSQFGPIRQAWASFKDITMFIRFFAQVLDYEALTELILIANEVMDHGTDTTNPNAQ